MIIRMNSEKAKLNDFQKRCNANLVDYKFGEVNFDGSTYHVSFLLKGVPQNFKISKISKKHIMKQKGQVAKSVSALLLTEVLQKQVKIDNKLVINKNQYYNNIDCSDSPSEKRAKTKKINETLDIVFNNLVIDIKNCVEQRKAFWLEIQNMNQEKKSKKLKSNNNDCDIDFNNLTKYSIYQKKFKR